MTRFLLCILSVLCFMCSETQAKVAPPNQVSSISFEWGGAKVELSLYTEPQKKPHDRVTRRQFYRATVHSGDGRKQELQEEAAPISPSRETDVQMIRYGHIRAEFTVGQEMPKVQLGKDAQVHLPCDTRLDVRKSTPAPLFLGCASPCKSSAPCGTPRLRSAILRSLCDTFYYDKNTLAACKGVFVCGFVYKFSRSVSRT